MDDQAALSGSLTPDQKNAVLSAALDFQLRRRPELFARYDRRQMDLVRQDTAFHLEFLMEALRYGSSALFQDYAAWLKVFLPRAGVLPADIELSLEAMAEALRPVLPAPDADRAAGYVEDAKARLAAAPAEPASFLEEKAGISLLASRYLQALLRSDKAGASRLVLDAVDGGMPVRDVYLGVFQNTQYEVGRLWQTGRISVAREHFCTAATQTVMAQLYPRLFGGPKKDRKAVAACVSGELHEIGARMVADLFEMDGWDTQYLGANTPAAEVVRQVRESGAGLLAVSATMTFHLPQVARLIEGVRALPEAKHIKVLVGGYPFKVEPALWQRLGADGTAPDAASAAALAERLTANPV